MLEKNERLTNATQEYEAATIVHTTFTNEGYGELYSLIIEVPTFSFTPLFN